MKISFDRCGVAKLRGITLISNQVWREYESWKNAKPLLFGGYKIRGLRIICMTQKEMRKKIESEGDNCFFVPYFS